MAASQMHDMKKPPSGSTSPRYGSITVTRMKSIIIAFQITYLLLVDQKDPAEKGSGCGDRCMEESRESGSNILLSNKWTLLILPVLKQKPD
ncbi:hypothetical protein LIER_27410 [Lithospermum erythrorhizon]|uniref:Uncharacterized protein n=1 Tax=Lithospermum erythrorhizon TaxID=34254 RepID=A0AAV3RDL9_LITER